MKRGREEREMEGRERKEGAERKEERYGREGDREGGVLGEREERGDG